MSAWIDGRAASIDELHALARINDGHFTTMQVRGRAVQGFDLHLQRLRDATRELLACDLDPDRVRDELRGALLAGDVADCTLRARIFVRGPDAMPDATHVDTAPAMLVSIAPPAEPVPAPLRIKSYGHTRALPHIKHVGTFPLFHHRRLALRDGFDDALLVGPDGAIAEGSFWNIGFRDGDSVVWPKAPALRGVTERLLQAGLKEAGVPQRTLPVRLSMLSDFSAAFAVNTRGVQAIAGIDGVDFAVADGFHHLLQDTLARRAWQTI
jgi:branched-subunit amino acid aminotransferase/4-amino-4-deoxychorismate lyase